MPYEERLNHLKWPTLEQRRLFSSLMECYKTINSLDGLDPSAFFTFANDFWPYEPIIVLNSSLHQQL